MASSLRSHVGLLQDSMSYGRAADKGMQNTFYAHTRARMQTCLEDYAESIPVKQSTTFKQYIYLILFDSISIYMPITGLEQPKLVSLANPANVCVCANICATWIPSRFHLALSSTAFTPNISFTVVEGLQGAIIIVISKLLSNTFR